MMKMMKNLLILIKKLKYKIIKKTFLMCNKTNKKTLIVVMQNKTINSRKWNKKYFNINHNKINKKNNINLKIKINKVYTLKVFLKMSKRLRKNKIKHVQMIMQIFLQVLLIRKSNNKIFFLRICLKKK